jgi:site-specific DNA recombinase
VLSSGSTSDQLKVELNGCNVECDVRERPQYENLAEDIKADFDAGMPLKEMEKKYSCSYTVVTNALNHWHDAHGVPRPDGRSLRQRLPANRASDRLMVEIMELWQQDLPVRDIAARLDCGLETVRAAVVTWHESRGLPVPDGRERRKRIRLERENANS